MSDRSIGLLGLGNMGFALARRLLGRGATLHVHDPDPDALARTTALGAIAHGSCRAVADSAPVVITCVPTVDISAEVAAEAAAGTAIRYYLEMSTIGPQAAMALQRLLDAKSIDLVDAPVSGGAQAAVAGTLAIMVAGRPEAVGAVRWVLELISDQVFVIGDSAGHAQAMKLVNNLLAAANMANAFEALVLGVKMGLEPASMVKLINAGSGRSMALVERRTDAILSGRFDSGPKIGLLHKDIGLALDAAQASGFPLAHAPALMGAAALWQHAAAAGMVSEDVSALIRVVEDAAGVVVRSSPEP